ncbi:hypothetical protein [Aeromonas caviae]|uniref:hypothetical protein n=1 Tax=Aeromonas caviae TaxID=648 RepID=UPI00244A222A|nr:hypothetical protein [Aeromonas caviae]MDH0306914.1 hypothetical protein [Aeromonas caviae]
MLLKIHASFLTSLKSLGSRPVSHSTSSAWRGILCRKRDEIRIYIVTVCRWLFFCSGYQPEQNSDNRPFMHLFSSSSAAILCGMQVFHDLERGFESGCWFCVLMDFHLLTQSGFHGLVAL